MKEHRLIELLRLKSAEVTGQTRFCPDDELIVKYFEGGLVEQERARAKHHLVDCRFCMARVGNLQRSDTEDHGQGVPGSVLADAKHLVKPSLPSSYTPAWATAAVVALALIIVTTRAPQSGWGPAATAPDVQVASEPPRELRSIDRTSPTPRIISPVEGDSIGAGELKIQWTEVQGSLHYNIRVLTAEGFIVWNDRVEGTEWKPPIDQPLESGVAYFVRVEAYLAEANSVSSEHVLFTMEEGKQ